MTSVEQIIARQKNELHNINQFWDSEKQVYFNIPESFKKYITDFHTSSIKEILEGEVQWLETEISWRDKQLERERDEEVREYLIGGINAHRDTINHLENIIKQLK